MTTKDSYAVAKEIIENFFTNLTAEPSKAVKWYTQDATLVWVIYQDTDNKDITILGKHSIHQFFKTVPELAYEVNSYDCQSVAGTPIPNITILVVSGSAYPVETPQATSAYSFHSTFHIQMIESETRAAICYHSMNLFEGEF